MRSDMAILSKTEINPAGLPERPMPSDYPDTATWIAAIQASHAAEPPWKDVHAAEEAWWDETIKPSLERFARTGDPLGCVLRFQVADGFALYQVTSLDPLTLTHVRYGDSWEIEPWAIRGLSLTDVKNHLQADYRMEQMFA
jgi:hypothetical protein